MNDAELPTEVTCQYCTKPFTAYSWDDKYCSDKCRQFSIGGPR